MIYVLKPKISFGNYTTEFVNSVSIKSSWGNLSDTADIVFPRKLKDENQSIFNSPEALFKVGDPVSVDLHYQNFEPVTRFSGFIVDVNPKLPVRIKCEDAMYLMKQFTMTKSFASVSLTELMKFVFESGGDLLQGYDFVNNSEINLGKFRVNRGTGAQVFEELKKKYGVNTYVKGNTFYVGFTYLEQDPPVKEFKFEENIISDNLTYRLSENTKIKVKAVSINDKNEKIEVEVGDAQGEQRTLNYYNKNEETLRQIATDDLDKLKYTGYKGSFTTFLHPYVEHSWPIKLSSLKIPERDGSYYISEVTTTFNSSGGRQTITLDRVNI